MDCPEPSELSSWIDGEIEDYDSSESIRLHVLGCADCRSVVLALKEPGDALRRALIVPGPSARRLILEKLLEAGSAMDPSFRSPGESLWRRRIVVPLPAALAAGFLLLALAGWIGVGSGLRKREAPVRPAPTSAGAGGLDLVRFDHRGPAVLFREEASR